MGTEGVTPGLAAVVVTMPKGVTYKKEMRRIGSRSLGNDEALNPNTLSADTNSL